MQFIIAFVFLINCDWSSEQEITLNHQRSVVKFYVPQTKVTQSEADLLCKNDNSRLVVIHEAVFQTLLQNGIRQSSAWLQDKPTTMWWVHGFWTSGINEGEGWRWADGSAIPLGTDSDGFQAWRRNQPTAGTNFTAETPGCVALTAIDKFSAAETGVTGVWYDNRCESHPRNYICQTFCKPNPCLNGGSCVSIPTTFRCECASTFVGDRCQSSVSAGTTTTITTATESTTTTRAPTSTTSRRSTTSTRRTPTTSQATANPAINPRTTEQLTETTADADKQAQQSTDNNNHGNLLLVVIISVSVILLIVLTASVVVMWIYRRRKTIEESAPIISNQSEDINRDVPSTSWKLQQSFGPETYEVTEFSTGVYELTETDPSPDLPDRSNSSSALKAYDHNVGPDANEIDHTSSSNQLYETICDSAEQKTEETEETSSENVRDYHHNVGPDLALMTSNETVNHTHNPNPMMKKTEDTSSENVEDDHHNVGPELSLMTSNETVTNTYNNPKPIMKNTGRISSETIEDYHHNVGPDLSLVESNEPVTNTYDTPKPFMKSTL